MCVCVCVCVCGGYSSFSLSAAWLAPVVGNMAARFFMLSLLYQRRTSPSPFPYKPQRKNPLTCTGSQTHPCSNQLWFSGDIIKNMAASTRAMLFGSTGGTPRRLDNPTDVQYMNLLYKWYFFKMTLLPGFTNCSEGLYVHLNNDYHPPPSLFWEITAVIERQK